MNEKMSKKWLTPAEVAVIYGFDTDTLCDWRKSNGGPSYFKFANQIRYAAADMESFMRKHTKNTQTMNGEDYAKNVS